MLLNFFAGASGNGWRRKPAYLIAFASMLAVLAGSQCLTSCAHTEKGLAREQALYVVATNAHGTLTQLAPYAPPPANSLLEGVLAAGGALLTVWATHLHRSVKELGNGQSPGPAAPRAADPAREPRGESVQGAVPAGEGRGPA